MTQAPSAVTTPAASTHCQENGIPIVRPLHERLDAGGVGLIGV